LINSYPITENRELITVKMTIYTKTGDKGETSLRNGLRVKKNDPQIEFNGELDELTAVLGLVSSFSKNPKTILQIEEIQHDLFLICAGETDELEKRVKTLEKTIDEMEKDLSPLKNFIYLGGSQAAAFLHFGRSVCRRAERGLVGMTGQMRQRDKWAKRVKVTF